jgi:pyrimidine deaminase RibD-like protein
MMQCYHLAQNHPDTVSGKSVASIIVKDDKIVGRGARTVVILSRAPYRDTTFHAEHIALLQATEKAEGATLYATLEPCRIRDISDICCLPPKPCCELIIESKIKKVVYGISENNHDLTLSPLKAEENLQDKPQGLSSGVPPPLSDYLSMRHNQYHTRESPIDYIKPSPSQFTPALKHDAPLRRFYGGGAEYLQENGVEVYICGGIDKEAFKKQFRTL